MKLPDPHLKVWLPQSSSPQAAILVAPCLSQATPSLPTSPLSAPLKQMQKCVGSGRKQTGVGLECR